MGCLCSARRTENPEIDTICRFLIKQISECICSSRNNVKVFEPTYYFLNMVLENSIKRKQSSVQLLQAFKELQGNLPFLLQQSPIDEGAFIKLLQQIQNAFVQLYDEKFDLLGKMKNIENLSNTLGSEFLEEFFLNEGAQFWFKSFKEKDIVTFEYFYEKFTKAFPDVFEKEVPEDKKGSLPEIKENLKLMMRNLLESNNNRWVTKEAWNVFYFKKISDYDLKNQFVEEALAVPSEPLHNKIILRYIYSADENLKKPIEYHISEDGVDFNGFDNSSKKKDLSSYKEFIKIGRNRENDIVLLPQEVSRYHCELVMKKALIGNKIRNEFYVCNKSTCYTYFVVEDKGYLLGERIIFNLTENINFYVKAMHPPYKPNNNGYFYVEPEYLDCKRKQISSSYRVSQKPFIQIECMEDHNFDKKFEAPSEDNDYTITIGSGVNDSLKVHDKKKADGVESEYIKENHCYVKYDSHFKCWVIQDKTVILPGNKTFYKTLIKCEREGQYEDSNGVTMRGLKLLKGMKFYLANNVFLVEEP